MSQIPISSTPHTFPPPPSSSSYRRKRRCSCRSHRSTCCEGFLLGILLLGLILTIILLLWLTSINSTNSSTTSTIVSNLSSSFSSTTMTTTVITTVTTATTTTSSCWTWSWNTTGETILGITSTSGIGSNQLNSPWNLFIDQTNQILYIADSANHRIQRLYLNGSSTATTIAGQTNSPGSTSTQLRTPRDIYLDSSQNLYVADSSNGRIQYFPNGNLNGQTVSSSWTNIGELWAIQLFNNSIYSNDKVKSILWRNGTSLFASFTPSLNEPQGFVIDTLYLPGTIFVVNSKQQTVVRWAIGSTIGTIVAGVDGVQGNAANQLNYPVSMKLDSDANLFIVDNNNHRIQLYCRNSTSYGIGRTIVGTGSIGNDQRSFNFPAGIALDAIGNLYVADTSNHRIQKFKRLS